MMVCGREVEVRGRLVRIGRLHGDKYKFLDDPEEVLAGLRASRPRVDIFTFMQKLPETSPKYDYPTESDNLAVLPITTFSNWWNETLGFKARNKAKQAAKKGVIVREVPFDDALAHGIWEIYSETPVRQGRRFPHYGKSFEEVRRMSSTFLDSSVFIGAYLDDQLIGFIKLTADDGRTQAGMMHIISMIRHRDKAPTNALVAQAVRSCADRGISHLVYSHFAYGKKERSSLSDFKERNGFERINLPRYYVPLTGIGWAAFRLGLHHKFVDRLPGPLLAKARDIRYSWYKYRFPTLEQDT
jgi:Acetyltransferase (GNAT) domain